MPACGNARRGAPGTVRISVCEALKVSPLLGGVSVLGGHGGLQALMLSDGCSFV